MCQAPEPQNETKKNKRSTCIFMMGVSVMGERRSVNQKFHHNKC